jgi:hypothetical protein
MPYHILWLRGCDDLIESDTSLPDAGYLGKTGVIPGWPGDKVFPPQPMIDQTKKFRDTLISSGVEVAEEIMSDCGHTPFIEDPGKFSRIFHKWLTLIHFRNQLFC